MEAHIKKSAPINLGLPEPKLVQAINKRLRKYRMELVTAAAVLGDVINYGHWFVRARSKATPQNPNPRIMEGRIMNAAAQIPPCPAGGQDARRELGGLNLICSCPNDGHGCHGAFLLEIANREAA